MQVRQNRCKFDAGERGFFSELPNISNLQDIHQLTFVSKFCVVLHTLWLPQRHGNSIEFIASAPAAAFTSKGLAAAIQIFFIELLPVPQGLSDHVLVFLGCRHIWILIVF